MKLKVNEIFYSFQGEGIYTGIPASFIRLAECNLNCDFCDTDKSVVEELTPYDIFQRLVDYKSPRVIITGGEPLLQDLTELREGLRARGYRVHIETNGTQDIKHYGFDWVTVSPKPGEVLDRRIMMFAHEVKFLYGFNGWEEFKDGVEAEYVLNGLLLIQPIMSGGIITDQKMMQEALAYCKENPKYRLSVQLHRILNER